MGVGPSRSMLRVGRRSIWRIRKSENISSLARSWMIRIGFRIGILRPRCAGGGQAILQWIRFGAYRIRMISCEIAGDMTSKRIENGSDGRQIVHDFEVHESCSCMPEIGLIAELRIPDEPRSRSLALRAFIDLLRGRRFHGTAPSTIRIFGAEHERCGHLSYNRRRCSTRSRSEANPFLR